MSRYMRHMKDTLDITGSLNSLNGKQYNVYDYVMQEQSKGNMLDKVQVSPDSIKLTLYKKNKAKEVVFII